MATTDKVKYVGPGGAERYVRADNPAADTAARFDGFQPEGEASKAKPAARRSTAKKPAAKQPAAKADAKPAAATGDTASA